MKLTLDQARERFTPKQFEQIARQLQGEGGIPERLKPAPKRAVQGRATSQTERDFDGEPIRAIAERLDLRDVRTNDTADFYGGVWLNLARQCRYKPDRLARQRVHGDILFTRDVYIEVKGGDSRHGIHEDSRIKFKFATRVYPDALFLWCVRKQRGAPWRVQVWQDGEVIENFKV